MSKHIKQFFCEYDVPDEQYFLYYSFYKNPNNFILNKFQCYDNYLLNYKFLLFLKFCLHDDVFIKRLDQYSFRNIRYLLYDSKELLENIIISDKTLQILQASHLSKSFLQQILSSVRSSEDVLSLIHQLIKEEEDLETKYYEDVVVPIFEKKRVFSLIKNDCYHDVESCYLFARHGKDRESFRYLVCSNDFLDVVESFLLKIDLSPIIIDHIIEILIMGIQFRTLETIYEDFWSLYRILGRDKVIHFEYERAKELIKQLEKKKYFCEKIVSLEQYKRIRKS